MQGISIRVTLALASIGAGVIHFVVAPDHFAEFSLFGVFFLVLGTFQALWAGAALLKPNALVLVSGVVASGVVIAIWIVSRTVGLPIGPEAGTPEPLGLPDAVATGLEALIVVVGTFLLARGATSQRAADVAVEEEPERRAA